MSRYFFDLIGQRRSVYDYRGRCLPALDSARSLAELMALDLAMNVEDEWLGWTVDVRDVEGSSLFSVTVKSFDLAAA